jgi:hypothetical protein
VGSARLTDMEGKNYRMPLLTNSHPSYVMTQSSQNSAPVSFDPLSFIPVASVSVNFVLTCSPLLSHDGLWLLCMSDIEAKVL